MKEQKYKLVLPGFNARFCTVFSLLTISDGMHTDFLENHPKLFSRYLQGNLDKFCQGNETANTKLERSPNYVKIQINVAEFAYFS